MKILTVNHKLYSDFLTIFLRFSQNFPVWKYRFTHLPFAPQMLLMKHGFRAKNITSYLIYKMQLNLFKKDSLTILTNESSVYARARRALEDDIMSSIQSNAATLTALELLAFRPVFQIGQIVIGQFLLIRPCPWTFKKFTYLNKRA